MPVNEKPSRNEDEYFVRQDAELMKQLREARDAERARAEKQSRVCPNCRATLEERNLESVLLDVCPQCQGVWLDAGELDILRQTRGSRSFLDSLLGR